MGKNREAGLDNLEKIISEYYSREVDTIIDCPSQPGKLKISLKACLKRFQKARSEDSELSFRDDTFSYFISQGLLHCRKCTIIRDRMALSELASSSSPTLHEFNEVVESSIHNFK